VADKIGRYPALPSSSGVVGAPFRRYRPLGCPQALDTLDPGGPGPCHVPGALRPGSDGVRAPQCDEARRAGPVGDPSGVIGNHQARAPRRAKWPRSTFTKRDSFPLVVSSLSIEVYNVADGVLPPGDVQ